MIYDLCFSTLSRCEASLQCTELGPVLILLAYYNFLTICILSQ